MVSRIRKIKPSLVCLIETRVKEVNMPKIVNKWFPDWNICHNYPYACNGRIWLLWKDYLVISVVAVTDQCITVKVQTVLGCFFFSAVYGFNSNSERRTLWSHLLSLNDQVDVALWLLVSDYNIVADCTESLPPCDTASHRADMKEFNNCVHQVSLFDHQFSSSFFIWFNNHQEDFLSRKLDRASTTWLDNFPHSSVEFLSPEASDHCLGLVNL